MNEKTQKKYDSLPYLHSPSYIERVQFLDALMRYYDCTKNDAVALLARAIGQGKNSVEKRFRDPSTNSEGNYSTCPAVIWAAWMDIFEEAIK